MDTTLILSLSSCNLRSPLLTTNSLRQQKRKLKQKRKHIQHNTQPKLPFPKSYPTPLLTNPKPQPQTKLQALNAVIDELESSVEKGIKLDAQIFSSLLETCFNLQAFDHGFRIRRLIPEKLLRKNAGLSSKLLRLYASSGQIEDAHHMFDKMPERNASHSRGIRLSLGMLKWVSTRMHWRFTSKWRRKGSSRTISPSLGF